MVQICRNGLIYVFDLMIMCLFMLQNSAKYQAGRLGCHVGWYICMGPFGWIDGVGGLGIRRGPGTAPQQSGIK
jgi:hypothetical protein